jgi:dihydropteroate synthase
MTEASDRFILEFGSTIYDLSSRTHVMGILNVTPDSFSDGGKYFDPERAIEGGKTLAAEGADFLDVGGESTRPGAEPVGEEEEIRRVVPVIEGLVRSLKIPISVDTYKAAVAEAALEAGASIVNDISALTFDPKMAEVVAARGATVVLMHMAGTPRTMQEKPSYANVVKEVHDYLLSRAGNARDKGIRQILVDPGIGFGKNLEHNLTLLRNLRKCTPAGYPILVGPSRKSFIGKILDVQADDRLEGTASAVAACVLRGAHVVRVHDVKAMKRVSLVADALKDPGTQT